MAITLEIKVIQRNNMSTSNEMSTTSHTFYYNDVTDANLHNLSVQRAILKNAAELLGLKAQDPNRSGRKLTEEEVDEING